MHDFFHDTIIPELIEEEKKESGETLSKTEILKRFSLTKLSLETIYKWLASFGFKYNTVKKTYYVDGHEKPETVAYRKEYCTQYLSDEIRYFRWIQLSTAEVEEIEKENNEFVRDSAYVYKDIETGLTMFEFHVDELNNSHEKLKNAEFGGFLSVRK